MPCQIELGEIWDSFINGSREGSFTITQIDASGNFEGQFTNGGPTRIAGHCDQQGISFSRPANNPHFHYEGRFTGPRNLRGSRHGSDDESFARDAKTAEPPPPDDWEGVKVSGDD